MVLVSPDGQLTEGDEKTLAALLERRAEQSDEPARRSRAD